MSKNVYSEINIHMTWHTKNDEPALKAHIENRVHHYLQRQTIKAGAIFHEVGGTDDHIHLVATIPPTLLISDWIGKLKGGSSFHINHEIANRKLLDWQTGYGVVSFATKDLPWIVEYVRNQREHHARGTTKRRLELCEQEDEDEEGKGR